MATLRLKVKMAWWLKVYIGTLVVLGRLTHMEPNMDRVAYWIGKGIKLKVVPNSDGIGGA